MERPVLWYLATPFTYYRAGLGKAYEDTCVLAWRLTVKGFTVYSPIIHCDIIARAGGLARTGPGRAWYHDHNERMMLACDRCLVGMLAGWDNSKGVAEEIEFFESLHKPVRFVDPLSLEIEAVAVA